MKSFVKWQKFGSDLFGFSISEMINLSLFSTSSVFFLVFWG